MDWPIEFSMLIGIRHERGSDDDRADQRGQDDKMNKENETRASI